MHHESMSVSVRVVSKGTLDNVASSADPRDLAGDLTSPRPAQLLARCMDGIHYFHFAHSLTVQE